MTRKIILIISTFAAAFGVSNAAPRDIEYKVERFNGVPRITEDGKPVRGRVFWGAAGGMILPKIDLQWTRTSFEFTPTRDYSKTNLQFTCGEAAGKYWIADFEVKNLTTGETIRSVDFSKPKRDPHLAYWCSGMNENPPLKISNIKTDGAPNGAMCVEVLERTTKIGGLHFYMGDIPLKKRQPLRVLAPRKSRTAAQSPFLPVQHRKRVRILERERQADFSPAG